MQFRGIMKATIAQMFIMTLLARIKWPLNESETSRFSKCISLSWKAGKMFCLVEPQCPFEQPELFCLRMNRIVWENYPTVKTGVRQKVILFENFYQKTIRFTRYCLFTKFWPKDDMVQPIQSFKKILIKRQYGSTYIVF